MLLDAIAAPLLFALVATITPGGATTMATASGARFGFRRSLPLMTGAAGALAMLAAASSVGLASLLLAAPSLQFAIKLVGSAYLLWLALRVGRSGPPNLDRDMAAPTSFIGGACILLLNPKGWAMALGAAASFASLAGGPAQLALLLGVAFGLAALTSLCLWCATGLMLARLVRSERQWRLVNAGLGILLALSILPMWLE